MARNKAYTCQGCGALCRTNGRNTFHCCSCPPPPPPPPPPKRGCFPSTARVSLENGKSVMMSELQEEDHVQIGIYIPLLNQVCYLVKFYYKVNVFTIHMLDNMNLKYSSFRRQIDLWCS